MEQKNESKEQQLLEEIISAMQAKKGHNIVQLDLRHIDKAVCDYFVICHADSAPHAKTLADEVEERVASATGEWPWRASGRENALWIVLDYFSVVVHIFSASKRTFYDLETLWADAKRTDFPEE